ncbi:unnamed protein product [Rotaria sordida]|uniref:Uncharacterized protein n=1 Tax=Rotaria sordida TaxID=392033 RepID=A0A814RA37_9BILA|nr:unnamed protein product [Rotaria sordida]CAF0991826.1 unnamed protein product [Rotaria sordida]CAF1131121.1 unnamed protein product [Rotaria sordida]CAF1166051.1 unnamed protein product [Rotaria sordida]CAF1263834.1 unnamed protein product [Rotaria sordida]
MNFVRVSGRIGQTTLWISLSSYFISLILYLISFSLPDWIVYTSIPVKIGLWRLCDIQIIGYDRCSDWNARVYLTNITNSGFLGPPDFIRTSQSLEIVAFIFYIIGGILFLTGLTQRSIGLLFFGSSISIFITVIFTSSTICLFALQGKSSYIGYLSFSWWIALVAFIISLINALSSFILSFYIQPPPNINQNNINVKNDKMFYSLPPYSSDVYLAEH